MGTNATSAQFDQVEVSKNLSQLIRSNTPHYWTYMKHRADLSSLKPYLPFEGIVSGDPHMGNFSVLPLKQVGGSRQMRYADIDFDDAGRGPFVLDIIRYLIAAKSIGGQIKKRPLEASYLAGIAGKALDPPKAVRSLLAMPVSDYDDMARRYVEKNSSKHGFVFRKGKIEQVQREDCPRHDRTAVSPPRKSSIWQSGPKNVAGVSISCASGSWSNSRNPGASSS